MTRSKTLREQELESDIAMLRRGIGKAYAALNEVENEWLRRFNERLDRASFDRAAKRDKRRKK